jgi:predicted adenine nucleotide alpha hydrolase (AANH) superfamily ATPase
MLEQPDNSSTPVGQHLRGGWILIPFYTLVITKKQKTRTGIQLPYLYRTNSILKSRYDNIKTMKVALHICCAVCASAAAERLMREGHQVQGFFYNPNIYPEEEYRLRLANAQKAAAELGFPLAEGPYLPQEWNKSVASLENEPEGGKRCFVCFRLRLAATREFMLKSGCEAFTTTLTMGSNKSGTLIGQIGHEIGAEQFLERDFKKKEGFKRAAELAKKWGLYRQHYCGCIYSLR